MTESTDNAKTEQHCPECCKPGCLPEATDFQKRETNHFAIVGFLIPSRSGKSFKVLVEVDGKQVFIGLVSKEVLLESLSLKPMVTVKICRFMCNPEAARQRLNCIREANAEKLDSTRGLENG